MFHGNERVFYVSPDIPHVACAVCGAVMLVAIDENISSVPTAIVSTMEHEDVGVSIKVPFRHEFMKTRAYKGFVAGCPFCQLRFEEHLKNVLMKQHIILS